MSKKKDTEQGEGVSRRALLTTGIAAAAGIVASAVVPDIAAADNGGTLQIGGVNTGTETTYVSSNTGDSTSGTQLATIVLGNLAGTYPTYPMQGVYSTVWSPAPAGSSAIKGEATTAGNIGVEATNDAGATALKVRGRTSLSRSGQAWIGTGKTNVSVTVPTGVSTSSKILVTLQSDGGSGVYLKYAARTGGSTFKVYLTKAAARAVKFSWMITD